MSGIVDQLPTLIGVVVGAGGSYLVGTARDRVGWRRSQSTRWDQTRAHAYADYARALKSVYLQCVRITDSRRFAAPDAATGDAASLAELDRLAGERTAVWELVLLVGDPAAVAAGRTWHRRVGLMEKLARSEGDGAIDYQALYDDIDNDRTRFYQAARRDLGIESGDVPFGSRWDLDLSHYAIKRHPRTTRECGR